MKECSLSNLILKNTEFEKCNLCETNFTNTSLSGIDLRTCDISGIITYANDIRGVVLTRDQSLAFIKLLGITIID